MRSSLMLAAAVGALCLPMLSADPAHAQATRTWVSGVGDDVNPCSRTAPWKTFAGAISKTFINGEINCLDPGGFGTVTITKSITIDCHEIFASILASGTTGININVAAGNANDPLRTVRLRNININGAGANGAVGTRTGLVGVNIISALHVFLDDMLITEFTQQAVKDNRNGSGNLYVRNSIIRDGGGTGIAVFPSAGTVDAVIDNTHMLRTTFGVSAGLNSRVMVNNSVMMGNSTQGAHADNGGNLTIDRSVISGNVTGIGVDAGGTVRLSNTDITFNGTGITGTTLSYGNNRLLGNTAPGTAPTPAGAVST